MSLHPTRTRVRSRLKLRPNPSVAKPGALRLDGELLELESVRLDGRQLGGARLQADRQGAGDRRAAQGRVRRSTSSPIATPTPTRRSRGLYLSKGIYCTQCEAQGFRRITYFLDRPDVLATYTVRIEADRDEAPVLLANGNPMERGTLDGGQAPLRRLARSAPQALLPVRAGRRQPRLHRLRVHHAHRAGRSICASTSSPARRAAAPGPWTALKRSMRWDEERFGREYDLDVFNIVAVSDFNMGAMENKGLNIFNDALVLASPETATDAAFVSIERVIAHEYFHNWTGNRITCRDWFQLCLKEGLTVFRDQEFCADQRSAAVQRIREVRNLKARQFPEDAGPLAHPVRPRPLHRDQQLLHGHRLQKGAEVVRMLQTLLGRDGFRKGMDLYFERHDGQAATVEDFVACFADASGRDLAQFMTWYSQAGTPELACRLKLRRPRQDRRADDHPGPAAHARPADEEAAAHPRQARAARRQRPGPGPDAGLGRAARRTGSSSSGSAARSSASATLPRKPVVSLLRGFSAPVNLTIDRTDAELAVPDGQRQRPVQPLAGGAGLCRARADCRPSPHGAARSGRRSPRGSSTRWR